MTILSALLAAGIICSACTADNTLLLRVSSNEQVPNTQEQSYQENPEFRYQSSSKTGAYLSSRIARLQDDWEAASYFFDDIVDANAENLTVIYQAMIMAINAGRYDEAILKARILADEKDDHALTYVIALMGDIRDGDIDTAVLRLENMPDDELSNLLKGPLGAWVYSFKNDDEALKSLDASKAFTSYQKIVAADILGQSDRIESLSKKAKSLHELPPVLQAHLGSIFNLRDISYEGKLVGKTSEERKAVSARNVEDIKEGLAWIFYDLAMPLYLQYQDETGRLLFHMALSLKPDMTDARIRIAEYAAGSERIDEAIKILQDVSPESPSHDLVQKLIAELLVDQGRHHEALDILKTMAEAENDISLYVQIGGIFAKNDQYKDSLDAYNKALTLVGEAEKASYWQIFFARGRIYDAMGKWNKAEKDLLKALSFQPEQPFLLNYIGYSWADRGLNLDQALEMIEKAVEIQPNDGAIRDSLGWVYFRLGAYKKATHHLELAATLMPYDPVINDHLGDAYWKVGRRAEAEFQWKRALNHAEDDDLITTIEEKLSRY